MCAQCDVDGDKSVVNEIERLADQLSALGYEVED
jgi:hypothetical protein